MSGPSESITPNTVLLILLLRELNDINELDINQNLSKFTIDRILDQKVWTSFAAFKNDLKKETKNPLLVRLVVDKISKLRGLNDINKYINDSLKKLKLWNYKADELDKPKVCQGNIVDIFIRKTWLNLNKMAFSDLVNFYSDYKKFFFPEDNRLDNDPTIKSLQQSDKVYLELSQKIENFSHAIGFENIEERIEELAQNSNKLKISYLNYQNNAQDSKTLPAVENLHKFFDQNLKHLIMERVRGEQKEQGCDL